MYVVNSTVFYSLIQPRSHCYNLFVGCANNILNILESNGNIEFLINLSSLTHKNIHLYVN